jgi:hypothetical protein
MAKEGATELLWMLDSSTFIHALIVERVALVVLLRSPLCFPEYVFRFELGPNAHKTTRTEAASFVNRKQIGVANLTLADLDRIASLGAPRRIGLGEIACAVIAERRAGGILCDDWRARGWLETRTNTQRWDSIDGVLLEAAAEGRIGELDLVDFQKTLEQNHYHCRCDLRLAHLQEQMSRRAE